MVIPFTAISFRKEKTQKRQLVSSIELEVQVINYPIYTPLSSFIYVTKQTFCAKGLKHPSAYPKVEEAFEPITK